MANSSAVVSTNDVSRAKLELDRMKRSLKSWLKFRQINDAVVSGIAPTTKPLAYAREVVLQGRDWNAEQRLASQLHVLLAESFPGTPLPAANVSVDPDAAVRLALMAINEPGSISRSPEAQGGIPWIWPVAIVGGLLLAVTTAIKSSADVSKEKERLACVQAGACTDSGFWLKAGGVAALVYVGWKMGVLDALQRGVKGAFKG